MSKNKPARRKARRYVVIFAAPGTQVLDITGPFAVFARANEIVSANGSAAPPQYRVEVVTTGPGLLTTCCGLRLEAHGTIEDVDGGVDTLLVAGGAHIENGLVKEPVLQWVRDIARSARRVGSICTGAFLLAEAGLLDRKTATTHWKYCQRLAAKYPQIQVEPDPIFTNSGNLYTSAGVTAGMDLALALVGEDLGAAVALQVARELVLYLRRPGGQSQFSAALMLQASEKAPFRDLTAWVLDHLTDDLTVEALARHAVMSTRNFFRVFSEEFSTTPGKFVELLRLEAARRRLQESSVSVDKIAAECGFGSADVMRTVFKRVLKISPSDYRRRFGT